MCGGDGLHGGHDDAGTPPQKNKLEGSKCQGISSADLTGLDGPSAIPHAQGSTKIYKAPPPGVDRRPPRPFVPEQEQQQERGQGRTTTLQSFRATVAAGATLALLPDPYTCFRGADYRQLQAVEVERGGSLVLVDWFTSGRCVVGRADRCCRPLSRLSAIT